MLPSENLNRKGFTLVEIILALMIASIMAGFLTVYFDVSFQNGGAAVSNLQGSLQLHSVMEKITTDYSNNMTWKTANRYRPGAMIMTSGVILEVDEINECISGTINPTFPGDDGGCKWKNPTDTTITTLLQMLDANVTAKAYSWFDGTQYIDDYIVTAKSVEFNEQTAGSGNYEEVNGPDPPNILKVTLSSKNGEQLTAYFPEP